MQGHVETVRCVVFLCCSNLTYIPGHVDAQLPLQLLPACAAWGPDQQLCPA